MSPLGDAPLELVVMTAEATHTRLLPKQGRVTIGRGAQNDVHLVDLSVSRRHAVMHLDGVLRIEDVGSANGLRVTTHVGKDGATARIIETHVPPGGSMPIEVADWVQIGTTLLFIQPARHEHEPEEGAVSTRLVHALPVPVVHEEKMRKLHETTALVAKSSLSILLLGETGVGKDVMAESIHRLSLRAEGPMICLNCATLSESLLESELFGHEAGAFTGAVRAKPGLFELAEKGTVFLDEVGELTASIQVKLLRVLEERKVQRVGGLTKRSIDVRFISATNRGLEAEAQRGAFRQDLFFRLNGISITIPPLRERRLEVEPLARSFIKRMAAQMMWQSTPSLSEEALEALLLYMWPGNIRELRNVMERAVVLSGGGTILVDHLRLGAEAVSMPPSHSVSSVSSASATVPPPPHSRPDLAGLQQFAPIVPLRMRAGEEERGRIQEALERCGGNQTQAAEMLGISRRTLLTRLDLYGLPRPRKKE